MALVVLVEATLVMRPRFMGDRPIGFELGALPKAVPAPAVAPAPGVTASLSDPLDAFARQYGLSSTEQAIVSLVAQGRSRTYIADALNYSENTIRNYTRTVYRKVGVHSKQELLDRVAEADGHA